MSWLDIMNRVIDYIEDHLTEEIDMEEIATLSTYSSVTFQRMFSIVCNITLSEYIRGRRLTMAAFDLQNSDEKIIDIAFKYNYDSPEAFARAFKSIHGISPSEARKKGSVLMAHPRLSFQLQLKGDVPMNYRIEEKEAFTVYGIERVLSLKDGANFKECPEFWQEIVTNGTYQKLIDSTNLPVPASGINLTNAIDCYRDTGKDSFPYMVFAFKTDKSETKDFTELEVPAATWAVFKSEMHTMEGTSEAIGNLIKRVYSEWLPTAGYQKIEQYDMELTYKDGKDYYSEIWMRVKPIKK